MIPRRRPKQAREEFERFVAAGGADLLRTAYLVLWDLGEAEDVVQEALLRVARQWPRVRSMEHPAAYARRVVVNLALDRAERRSRRQAELNGGRAQEHADAAAERELGRLAASSDLYEALGSLPPRQRAALVLRFFADLSEADVAATLGCSLGTVKSTVSRGLARLEQELGRDGSHPVPAKTRSTT